MRYLSCLSLFLLLLPSLLGVTAKAHSAELQTSYATLIYSDNVQLKAFNKKVRLGGLRFSFSKSSVVKLEAEVEQKINQICGRVQEILEMTPKDLNFRIQLLPDSREVQKIYQRQYQRKVDFIAFYSPRTKTVYFSVKDLRLRVFAHEIAHAVLDHYFENPPPVKIHEMLAQYVEKQL